MSLRVGHLNMLVSLHLVKVSSVRTGIEKIDHLPQAVSSLLIAEARLIHDCLFRECDVSVQLLQLSTAISEHAEGDGGDAFQRDRSTRPRKVVDQPITRQQ